jgi:3-isopropylmalate dehydratase small subunit
MAACQRRDHFEHLTFHSNDAPQTVMFNAKVKKYQTAQIIVKNDRAGEAFGLYKIEKTYVTQNYSKK